MVQVSRGLGIIGCVTHKTLRAQAGTLSARASCRRFDHVRSRPNLSPPEGSLVQRSIKVPVYLYHLPIAATLVRSHIPVYIPSASIAFVNTSDIDRR